MLTCYGLGLQLKLKLRLEFRFTPIGRFLAITDFVFFMFSGNGKLQNKKNTMRTFLQIRRERNLTDNTWSILQLPQSQEEQPKVFSILGSKYQSRYHTRELWRKSECSIAITETFTRNFLKLYKFRQL